MQPRPAKHEPHVRKAEFRGHRPRPLHFYVRRPDYRHLPPLMSVVESTAVS